MYKGYCITLSMRQVSRNKIGTFSGFEGLVIYNDTMELPCTHFLADTPLHPCPILSTCSSRESGNFYDS